MPFVSIMTKVLINSDLLSFQQAMKESLRQMIRHNDVNGAPQPCVVGSPFTQELRHERSFRQEHVPRPAGARG
jgi:hypothetical protein